MSATSIAKRYASSLLEEALSRDLDATIERDFVMIMNVADASPDLRMLFRSPIIDWARKKKVIAEVFGGRVSPLMMNFMVLVIEKGRERFFREMANEFVRMLDEHRNILQVSVDAAKPLDQDSRDALVSTLTKQSGKTVMATFGEEPSLIGGVRVTIGDKVYDGSLKRQLEDLRDRIASATEN